MVTRGMLQVLGHLAADVAKWLGPLVVGGLVDAAGAVLEDPTAPGAPTTIAVQARPSPLGAGNRPIHQHSQAACSAPRSTTRAAPHPRGSPQGPATIRTQAPDRATAFSRVAQVGFPPDMLLLSPRRQGRVRGSLQKAAAAAADNLARQARRSEPRSLTLCLSILCTWR